MMSQYDTNIKCILSILLCYVIVGCTSPTKPNEPFPGPYSFGFNELADKNRFLAQELAKLPELQDGISEEEETALDILAEQYNANPDKFDYMFKQMYNVGIPRVRKYCSPLQALFWMAEEGLLHTTNDLISNYSLDKLLSKAWYFGPPAVSDMEILEIINGINDAKIRQQYLDYRKHVGNSRLQKILMVDLKHIKHVVSKDARKIIKSLKIENPKWSDFVTVTERLNAPELVDYYEQRRFEYVREVPASNKIGYPHWVFKNNKGNCIYITSFTIYCLKKGGYKAWDQRIPSEAPGVYYHSITAFYWNEKKYVMDNGRRGFKAGIKTWEKYFHPF